MAHRQSFNTLNCVGTPVNPISRLPMPSYERRPSSRSDDERGSSRGTVKSESPLTVEVADEEEEDLAGMISNQPPSFHLSMSEMLPTTENCENCATDDNFYEKLTSLKQQNITHLQQLENELYNTGRYSDGGKYKRSGSARSDSHAKTPLFVLDMPCYCDEAKSETTDHYDDVLDENDENDNLDDNIEALFNGVSDDDSDLDFNEDIGSRRSRSSGKRSIRVQSAPTVINEKRPFSAAPHVFKKTEIKPFKMSLREEMKAKEKALLEEMLKGQKEQETSDSDETNEFKAKPVPEHVMKPIFSKMVEKHPHRFKVGPNKPNPNGLKRSKSVPNNLDIEGGFRARPYPKEIFTDYAYEQMQETERYRDVRKALRQKALLSTSKYPPRMEKELSNKNVPKKPKVIYQEPKSVPYKASIVPDFDKSYQRFVKSLQRSKMSRPTSVIQPFSFDAQIDYYKKGKNVVQKEPMESFKPKTEPKNPNLSSSYTEAVLASSRNATSTLRSQHNKKKQEIYAKQELIERRKLLQNEMRQIEMRENHPAWQKLRHENVDHSNIQAKKLQRVLEAREESREYKLELEKMMMRVQNQPTLFERQSAMSAKQKAEKRYQSVLQKEGVSEDEISKLISMDEDELYRKKMSY